LILHQPTLQVKDYIEELLLLTRVQQQQQQRHKEGFRRNSNNNNNNNNNTSVREPTDTLITKTTVPFIEEMGCTASTEAGVSVMATEQAKSNNNNNNHQKGTY
jgi:hypothetical protein